NSGEERRRSRPEKRDVADERDRHLWRRRCFRRGQRRGRRDRSERHDRSVSPPAPRGAYAPVVRILLVSQMYPGPDAPDLGTFVAQLEDALTARGHDVEL